MGVPSRLLRTASEIVPGWHHRKTPLALLLIIRSVVYSHEMTRYLYWNAECRRSSGLPASLWGRWGPFSHTADPEKNDGSSSFDPTKRSPTYPQPHLGRGVSHWPCCGSRLRFCNRLRARVATVRAEHAGVASYATWVEETFPDSQLRSLALQGGTIIRQRGGYTMLRSKCRGARCAIARANSSSPKSIIPYSRPNIQR